MAVDYEISHFGEATEEELLRLPDDIAARYVVLTRRMIALGPGLGEPHTKALGNGRFELRLKGTEGIARVFFCTLAGRRIVMLRAFVKQTQRTPRGEREIAEARMKEVKRANA